MPRQAQNSRISLTLVKLLLLLCMVVIEVKAQVGYPADDEFRALSEIADQLGKRDWNFRVDPCTSNDQSWTTTQVNSNQPFCYNNALICNCNFTNDGVCHVVQMSISTNNLSGLIPAYWGKITTFKILEIQASGLEGPIPPSISALSTLTELDLSFNRLEGNVPDLGGLAKLELVFLTSNLLTGSIPEWIKSST
nr:isoform 2 of probable lrr receptor-like serine/threonine-protein kinase [Quercus suber]